MKKILCVLVTCMSLLCAGCAGGGQDGSNSLPNSDSTTQSGSDISSDASNDSSEDDTSSDPSGDISDDTSSGSSGDSTVEETYFKVSFIQEGQEPISFEVKSGESFDVSKIPQIIIFKKGYSAVWEEKDYTSITEDLEISVIFIPNTYTITYYLTKDGEAYETQTVTFDSEFTLLATASLYGKNFVRWECMNSEESIPETTWTKDGNLNLVAVWEDKSEEDFWSPFG